MDTFDVYMEGKGGFGVTGLFKPTPAYRIEGDFLDRNFRLVIVLWLILCDASHVLICMYSIN